MKNVPEYCVIIATICTFLTPRSLSLSSKLWEVMQEDAQALHSTLDIYIRDEEFEKNITHQYPISNISWVEITSVKGSTVIFILQRIPAQVTVWENGIFQSLWGRGELVKPHSVKLNQNSKGGELQLWVTDMGDHCLKQFCIDPTRNYRGKWVGALGKCGPNSAGTALNPVQFDKVTDLAWDSKGHMYVADGDIGGLNNRILKFSSNGVLLETWSAPNNSKGSGPKEFNLPHQLLVDTCDRVWVVDTLNFRIQIIDRQGEYLTEWKCFQSSETGELLHPYSVAQVENSGQIYLAVSTASVDFKHSAVFFIPVLMNCSDIIFVGVCKVSTSFKTEKLAHSIAASSIIPGQNNDLYIGIMSEGTLPRRYFAANYPPTMGDCSEKINPPSLPRSWTATLLLSPFHRREPLIASSVYYNATSEAMIIKLSTLDDPVSETNVFVLRNEIYMFQSEGLRENCIGPFENPSWKVPLPNWLNNSQCSCKGVQQLTGKAVNTWRCGGRENPFWISFDQETSVPYRLVQVVPGNAIMFPVIGDFSMVNFVEFSSQRNAEAESLLTRLLNCKQSVQFPKLPKGLQFDTSFVLKSFSQPSKQSSHLIPGLSTQLCQNMTFPSWPEVFYMTQVAFPVDSDDPMPSQVTYRYKNNTTDHEQRTRLFLSNGSFIDTILNKLGMVRVMRHRNGSWECLSYNPGLPPPVPDWMTRGKCLCRAVAKNSPLGNYNDNPMAIVSCPDFGETRQLWHWFYMDMVNQYQYTPVLLLETAPPVHEGGSSLAMDDDYDFYRSPIINSDIFDAPKECYKMRCV